MSKKMNPEVKALWLEKLRSGEFEQTKEYLHKGDGFCCLGVLCEVAVENGVIGRFPETREHSVDDVVFFYSDGSPDEDRYPEYSTLPKSVTNWAGTTTSNPWVKYTLSNGMETDVQLSDLNDDRGLSFEQIADIIEEQL